RSSPMPTSRLRAPRPRPTCAPTIGCSSSARSIPSAPRSRRLSYTPRLRQTAANPMDQGLKERLIGAAVLVALAVWLIPWLLVGPAQPLPEDDAPRRLPVPSGHVGEGRTEVIDLSPRRVGDANAGATSDSRASAGNERRAEPPAASPVESAGAAPPATA